MEPMDTPNRLRELRGETAGDGQRTAAAGHRSGRRRPAVARPDDLRKDQPMTQTTPTSTDRTAWIVAVIAFVVTLAMIVAEIN
jgi:hypothetical protein